MADYGQPRSFLDIDAGVDVVSSDGQRVGALEHVLSDEQADIFDGIVIDTALGPGGHRFVDAPEVSEFRERAVLLSVSAADVETLPQPREAGADRRRLVLRRRPRAADRRGSQGRDAAGARRAARRRPVNRGTPRNPHA